MSTVRVTEQLSKDGTSTKDAFAKQKPEQKGYWVNSSTFVESKDEPDVAITVEPLTFMISIDNDWARNNHWTIADAKDSGQTTGYTVDILDPNALCLSPKYGKPCDVSFNINKNDLEIFKKALETKSLDKAAAVLYKLAGKRVIDVAKSGGLFLKDIAGKADFLYVVADIITRAADSKLTQQQKPTVDASAIPGATKR